MRIHSLKLSGFRGFSSEQQFDLDADAVVVSGANGRGKTSLFDSILWALTGRIPRLGDVKNVVSLYSSTGEARAELALSHPDNDGTLTIIRHQGQDGGRLKLQTPEGRELVGDEARMELQRRLWPAAEASRVGTIAKTFTRSIYLEQDLVRQYIEADTDDERFTILSEVVGVGRVTELQQNISNAKKGWTRGTTPIAAEAEEWRDRVTDLEAKLARIGEGDDAAPELAEWDDWWVLVREELDWKEPPRVEEADASDLEPAIGRLEQEKQKLQRRRSRLEALREDLAELPDAPEEPEVSYAVQINELETELESAEKALAEARQRAEARRVELVKEKDTSEDLAALAQIALRHLGETCPVCTQEYDEQHTLEHLRHLLREGSDAEQPEHEGTQEEVRIASEAVERLTNELEAVRSTARDYERMNGVRQEAEEALWTRAIDAGFERSGSDLDDLRIWIEETRESAATRLAELRRLVETGEALSLALVRRTEHSTRQTVEAELAEARQKLADLEQTVKDRNRTGEVCDDVIAALRAGEQSIVQAEIQELEPLLRNVYAKIHPHPTFIDVGLQVSMYYGKGRLDPEIADPQLPEPVSQPSVVLSSSQMNALAVSLFLAFNFGTGDLPVDCMILDDPLQSLDDVNLLGMVDLLRRVRGRRQIFISTHDDGFGRLLQRKLRPVSPSQRTISLEFQDWSRSGPVIERREVPAETEKLKVVA